MKGPGSGAAGPRPQVPVAVVGLGALVPGATDPGGFWRAVLAGRDLITDVPASRWRVEDHYDQDPAAQDKTYARRGAFLPRVGFDPLAHGVPPATLSATDTAQLLALMVAEQVLTDAGGLAGADRDRVGVVIGAAATELLSHMQHRTQRPVWLAALRDNGVPQAQARAVCDAISGQYVPWQEATFPGLLANVVAGRIANRFDLHGVNHTTDAACASSFAALSTAVAELSLGRADLVLSGGVDTANDIGTFLCFSKTPALSPTGDCRPFSAAADGTMLGEAVVMYALKRLADAERDGDRIYAVVRGIGASSDGRATAVYAPLPAGQALALRRAYEQAGYGPGTVELVEAHGTGTKAGDAAEFAALRTVFTESGRDDLQWCALGSVKSQIGHTKCAAGAVGLLKAVLALHHKVLPPTAKVERPHPDMDVEHSPFHVNTEARPWVRASDHPRRASVSSFGFGGSNFHVTLEEYPAGPRPGPAAWRTRSVPTELVLFGASSPGALLERRIDGERTLVDLARESQGTFSPADPVRLAVVATDTADLRDKFARARERLGRQPDAPFSTPDGVHYATGAAGTGRVAFLFPGQGAQYVGMGGDIAMLSPAAQSVWDRFGSLGFDGRALHTVVFPTPCFTDEERAARRARLTATEWAQPALAVHSLALLDLVGRLGLRPDCVAGHSFGELVALHAAGALDAGPLVRLARRRGELMREAARAPGAMLAVAADRGRVAALLAADGVADVWPANHNAPRQVVLSGAADAVARAERTLAGAGVTCRRLDASTAFHSPLVAPAAGPLLDFVREMAVRAPGIDVYGNADASPYPGRPDEVRRRIADHVSSHVLFQESIEAMYTAGVRTFVEVGAGDTLTGLVGQILGARPHLAVPLDRRGHHGATTLHSALGRLAVSGARIDYEALWAPYAPPGAAAKERKPRMTVMIDGANHGRPEPSGGGAAVPPPPDAPWEEAVAVSTGAVPGAEAAAGPAPAPPAVPAVPAAEPVRAQDVPGGVCDPGWLAAVESVQRHAAESHAACQRMLTESHVAFLRMTETTLAAMLGVPPQALAAEETRAARVAGPPAASGPGTASVPAPLPPPRREEAREPSEPYRLPPAPLAPAPHEDAEAEAEGDATGHAEPPGPYAAHGADARGPGPATPPQEAAQHVPFDELLLSVVAEHTGYPADMLGMDMELASDLGVDSIKRVEILSAVRERLGDVPTGTAAELGGLHTLREIADAFASAVRRPSPAPGGGHAAAAGPPEPAPADDCLPEPAPADDPPGPGAAVDEGDGTAPAARPEPDGPGALRRLAVRAAETPAPGLALAALGEGPVAVLGDQAGLGALVAAELTRHGVAAQAVAELPGDARGVVYLAGLSGTDVPPDEARRLLRDAFRTARSAAGRMAEHGGVFVTVQDTGGDFGLRGRGSPWLGGLAALTRTAAKEWPDASVKAIDCERGGRDDRAVAAAVAGELLAGGPAPEVALRADGTRTTPRAVHAPVEAGEAREPRIGPESVIVATGGARGVTAAALLHLARAHRPRFLLLGRTDPADEPAGLPQAADEPELVRLLAAREADGVPPAEVAARARAVLAAREIRATLAELTEAGCEARYLPVDVRDARAVADALSGVRADWGPVTGVVHGAGVLADRLIADKTDAQFNRVMATKVDGLRALLAATAEDPLDFLCLFSSVAAVHGNPGQADYAMANAVLDHVASYVQARRPECVVRSIAWGPWRGGMVTPGLAERLGRSGVPLIPALRGAAAFAAEVNGPAGEPRVVVTAAEDTPDGEHASGPAGPAPWAATAPESAAPRPAQARVSAGSHSHLADHCVAGVPVLPLAVALDWFLGAAGAWRPDAGGAVLRDVRVFQKVALTELAGDGHRLTVRARPREIGRPQDLEAELGGEDGTPHVRAVLEFGGQEAAPEPWETPRGPAAEGLGEVYDGRVLFHGPRFQALRSVLLVSAHGAEATVAGVRELEWPGGHWHTDPAAVDGALQLALLWARQALGGATLPMAVAECRVHRGGPVEGTVRCVVRGRKVHETGARCDAALLGQDGTPWVELLGVELVRRPD
ncbi:SDR family oxidoreductase [Streptomyces sp. NPDC047002]|uniref:SDR family oxidoreductase n=1 Tax=Streptomyces sp. NPDC047002 TaxID=3155475 RepID=UPI003451BABA